MDENEILNENVEVAESAIPSDTSAVEPNEEHTTVAESGDESSNVVGNEVANGNDERTNRNQYSDLEKAQYSFHKQFARQKAKHDREIADLRKEFEKRLADELDKRDHPEKYRPKTRADFQYDDEYVDYLADRRVNKVLDERLAAYQEEQERIAAQNEADEEYKQIVNESVKRIYNTPEAENDWRTKVGDAMQKGLGKMLDSDEDLSNFILTSPIGPKIMYELATNKKAVQDLFVMGTLPNGKVIPRSPGDRMRKIEQLAEKLETVINNNKAPIQPQKALGKPGITKEVKKDIWNDSKALLDMMYN
jgi:hypothetical protein